MKANSKNKTYLVITASGGAGLLQAAKALEQRIKRKDRLSDVIIEDVMLEWLGGMLGNFGVSMWNRAQKKGYIKIQEFLIFCQRLAEIIFWPHIFYYAFKILIKQNVDYVYDLQPLCTSAIIKAIRLFNTIKKKKVVLKKVIVDLPTKKCTHYYNNIKRLSKNDKELIYIITIEPLLEKNQSDKDFWNRFCKISLDKISYDSYPIRLGFDLFKDNNKLHDKESYIKIKTKHEKEAFYLNEIVKKSKAEVKKNFPFFDFKIQQDDFLITILLGSQPTLNSTFKYVNSILNFLKNNSNLKKNIFVFAYCSVFKDGLNRAIYDKIMHFEDYPKNLTIIPMSFQSEEVIASLYNRSNLTVTRSGGQTAVELMSVSKAKFCVHTECRLKEYNEKKFLQGIPVWEAGSACYMKKKMNASYVNPETFMNICKPFLS